MSSKYRTLGPDNPVSEIKVLFRDGAGLCWTPDQPIPQPEFMMALGRLAAEVGQQLRLTGILVGDEEKSDGRA